jgi:hypothetical protein
MVTTRTTELTYSWPVLQVVNASNYPLILHLEGSAEIHRANPDMDVPGASPVSWTINPDPQLPPHRRSTYEPDDTGKSGTFSLDLYPGDTVNGIRLTLTATVNFNGTGQGPVCPFPPVSSH